MWFILGQITASGGDVFTPPGNTWTFYTSPISNTGDVYFDRTFNKWYLSPRAGGSLYYSDDGTTWTATGSVSYNAPRIQRANDKLWVGSAYNQSGSPTNVLTYSTNGTAFSTTGAPFSYSGVPAEDNYGRYVISQQGSNTSDRYAYSTNGTTWTTGTTAQSNDSFGSFSAGLYACWSDYSNVYRFYAGNLDVPVPLPSGNISRWSFLVSDKLAYLWESSFSSNNRMWVFNGGTFTQVALPRPSSTNYEGGYSIAIIGEDLLPGEFMMNFANGSNVNDARLYTPTYGHKYVLSYYSGAFGADYSPIDNMYLTRSESVSGSYYIMKSVG